MFTLYFTALFLFSFRLFGLIRFGLRLFGCAVHGIHFDFAQSIERADCRPQRVRHAHTFGIMRSSIIGRDELPQQRDFYFVHRFSPAFFPVHCFSLIPAAVSRVARADRSFCLARSPR